MRSARGVSHDRSIEQALIKSTRPTLTRRLCTRRDIHSGRPASRSLMRADTTFDLVGDLSGVDAVIVGPTGRTEVTLILDTAR